MDKALGKLLEKNASVGHDIRSEAKESMVTNLVRQKYSISSELAILRQRDTKPEEFEEYFNYVEKCKEIVKETIGI